jgi:hypothetical protein
MIKKTHAILDEYLHLQDIKVSCQEFYRGRHGRDRMIVGFTTTYAISAYHITDVVSSNLDQGELYNSL